MEFGKEELDLTADESPGGESLAGVLDGEPAIGEKEISEAMAILEKYKSAKASLDKRIIDNEEWYKLGHWKQYGNRVMEGKRAPSTGWLFNSIANKHADAMDNYPEPNVLPRAQDDEETARLLSDILPVVLEQADYESVYSDTWWRKLKQGTGVKGIFWDPALREGLGDIAIRSMFSFAAKREPENHQRFRRAGSTRKGLLAPFRPQRRSRNGKKLAASLNAFFSFLRLE